VEQKDYFTKLVTATVDYPEDSGRRGKTTLTTLVTNFNNAVGGDTCSSILTDAAGNPDAGAWKIPRIIKSVSNADIANQAGFPTDDFPITDIDAYKNRLYITVDNSSSSTLTVPTFFVFDITDPSNIMPISSVDNDLGVHSGLKAVVVAEDPAWPTNPKPVYAFVASTVGKHFQVIKVAESGSDLVPPVMMTNTLLPIGTSIQHGNSIAYKNGYIYLGLTNDGLAPEFYIIDVHNPQNPALVSGGTYAVGNDINAIYIRNQYAYLATPNSNNLIVLDVSNPSSPKPVGNFAPTGGGNGKSLYLRGDNLYLGRTIPSSGPELYILNNSDPLNISEISNKEIGESVDGVIVRTGLDLSASVSRDLAFLLTKTQFQVWDTGGLSPWTPGGSASEFLSLPGSGSGIEPVFDCEKNTFFVGSSDGSQGRIFVIAP